MDEIINYYDNLANSYDSNRFDNSYGKYIDQQERKILDKILNDKNEVILDLACGSGRLLNYASIGVDGSSKMIEVAKVKYSQKNILKSDAEDINLDSNSIDTIICFHFFMHLNESKIEKILEECSRILKPKGRIIFDIPSKKRRLLFNFKSNEWHGAFSSSFEELNQNKKLKINRTFGFLLLPIHRFPNFARKYFMQLDLFLANSIFKEYSSYLIIEFIKK